MPKEKNEGLSPLERYHRGIPLNSELQELHDGVKNAAVAASVLAMPPPPISDPLRALTKSERGDLRELKLHPGWRVLERLKEKTLQTAEKSAIAKSKIDPLVNAEEIANAWAYLAMLQQGYLALAVGIETELKVDERA